eukprot:3941134-Rhodomonas_salina.2
MSPQHPAVSRHAVHKPGCNDTKKKKKRHGRERCRGCGTGQAVRKRDVSHRPRPPRIPSPLGSARSLVGRSRTACVGGRRSR